MKKHVKCKKYIKYNTRHARKQKESHDRYKLFKKRNNAFIYKSKFITKEYNKRHTKSSEGYVDLTVPENFSIVENVEQSISFINDLDKLYRMKKPIFVNLYDVKNFGYETIVILLAIVIKFKKAKINFNGNYPNDEIARKRLIQSGFFEVLFGKHGMNSSISGNGIYTHSNKSVDAKLGSELISQASSFIWGSDRYCTGVQRTLIELMQNTNNHAGDIPGEKKWWVSLNCTDKEKKVIFAFVDFGKGIFNSLIKEKKWYQWFVRNKDNQSNAKILEQILKGQMHKTVTGQSHRGKGLPGIYESFQNNAFANLHIISNNVFADVGNNIYMDLSVNLNGTFVCWELVPTNKNFIPRD